MWTATSGLTGKKLRLAITITAVTGFSLFGYDQGLMSGLIAGDEFTNEFTTLKVPKGASKDVEDQISVYQGAVTASYEIGCLFGAIFTLIFGERIGRTPLVFSGGILMIIGALISTVSYNAYWGLGQFVVGRVVSGVGNGMDTANIPVWQSECSKAHNRGFLVCFEGAIIAVGTFVAYWVDFGMSYVSNSSQWRFPVALQIVFAIAVSIGAFMLPDSPRWFLMKGREQDAIEVLAKLNGTTVDDEQTLTEFNLMKADLKSAEESKGSFRTLFTFGKTQEFQRMILGCSGQFFQQFTGCNAAIYYSTVLFETNLNLGHQLSMIMGGVFATVYALATIPSFFMIEKVGRRKLYLIGFMGQGLSFIITMACLIRPSEMNANGAAVGIYVYIVFFAFTILPLPWIYPPEINPLRTRTMANAAATCTNWITNFAVVMFTPVFSSRSAWGLYLFFALFNFIAFVFGWFFYVETAGRDLEEIDIIFAKAHIEKKWPFVVANELPKLSVEQIGQLTAEYGLDNSAQSASAPHEKAEMAFSSDEGQRSDEPRDDSQEKQVAN